MSRVRGDIKDTVETCLFQRVGVRFWIAAKAAATVASAAAEFAAAVADEYQLYLLCKTGRVFDIVRRDGSAAEETDFELPANNVGIFRSLEPGGCMGQE